MKTCIYQYWNGQLPVGAEYSRNNIERYAGEIGSDYLFVENENYTASMGQFPQYYDAFRPWFDPYFEKYDKVLYLDMDVYCRTNNTDNIFDVDVEHVGIVEEREQTWMRHKYVVGGSINAQNDERWESVMRDRLDISLPRDYKGRIRTFNSGVVMYTQEGLKKCKENFMGFANYINWCQANQLPKFYQLDQNYLNAMLFSSLNVTPTIMDTKWNAQLHWHGPGPNRELNDERDSDTTLVHCQVSGSNQFDTTRLWNTINLPRDEW